MVKKAAVTKEYTHVTHPFPALYNKESEILILGSLPSVKSREQMLFLWASAESILESNRSSVK